MSSDSQKTERRRQLRLKRAGRKSKKARTKAGTPKFPIHAEKSGK